MSRQARITFVIGLAIALASMAGCLDRPGDAGDLPTDGFVVTITTAYERSSWTTQNYPGTHLPVGTPASFLQVVVYHNDEVAKGDWAYDKPCQGWVDRHRGIKSCSDVPVKDQYVVPPPGKEGEPGPAGSRHSYPLDREGTVRLIVPEPLDLWFRIEGLYPPQLQARMDDPDSCEYPSGGAAGQSDATTNIDRTSFKTVFQVRDDGWIKFKWYGSCRDNLAVD